MVATATTSLKTLHLAPLLSEPHGKRLCPKPLSLLLVYMALVLFDLHEQEVFWAESSVQHGLS